jgi:hypothetical protein
MFCPSCGVATQSGQRFCNACGAALTVETPAGRSTLPPPPVPRPDADTIAVPAGQIPPSAGAPLDDAPPTADFAVVEQTTSMGDQYGVAWEAGATDEWTDPTDTVPQLTEQHRFVVLAPPAPLRSVLLVLAIATAAITVTAAFLTVVQYQVTGDIDHSLVLKLNDISTNALVATLLAAALLIGGAALGLSGRRFGTGVAGGAGLAVAGFMGWMATVAVSIIDTVKQGLAAKGVNYRLSTTLDVGLWMCVAAAVLGGVVFFVSLTGAGPDGHTRVHPAVGALGVLGTVAVMIGPMLPMHSTTLADNFATDHTIGAPLWWKSFLRLSLGVTHDPVPPITTWMRILALVLLLAGGLIGFIAGSRWGLGMVLGSMGIALWQWITSLLEAGDWPFGIAGGNPGVDGFVPHVVTTVGVVMIIIALLAGTAMVYRERSSVAAATA